MARKPARGDQAASAKTPAGKGKAAAPMIAIAIISGNNFFISAPGRAEWQWLCQGRSKKSLS